MLDRDRVEDLLRHGPLHELPERRRIRHRVSVDDRDDGPFLRDVGQGHAGIDRLEPVVVRLTQKGKRRDERPRAHTRHELEPRARSRRGPAVEQAGAERAVVAASGDRQIRRGRKRAFLPRVVAIHRLGVERRQVVPFEVLDVGGVGREVTDRRREARHGRGGLEVFGDGVFSRRRGAALRKGGGERPREQELPPNPRKRGHAGCRLDQNPISGQTTAPPKETRRGPVSYTEALRCPGSAQMPRLAGWCTSSPSRRRCR